MRILLLTQVLPYPPDSGPKIKTLNLIKYVSQKHSITLVSFVRFDPPESVRALERWCESVHTVPIARSVFSDAYAVLVSLLRAEPFLMVRDDRAAMRRMVGHLVRGTRFDAVHADQLNMAQFALSLGSIHKILDAHNALWLVCQRLAQSMRRGPRRWFLQRESRLLRDYEGTIGRSFDGVLAVSEADRAALEEVIGTPANMHVVPIAIDTQEIQPLQRRADANRIVHMGTLIWPPNADGVRWFIESAYPRIRRERPEAWFDVVGANPPRSLRKLAGAGVRFAGYVEDPNPILETAGVFVVPVRAGGGMRVKILTALAQGLPIVSTSIGCEGIEAVDGRHLLLADTPEEFANATLRILRIPELADELGRNGRRLAEERYDYRVACRGLDGLYEDTTTRTHG